MQRQRNREPNEIPTHHLEAAATLAASFEAKPTQVEAFKAITRLAKNDMDFGEEGVQEDLAIVYAYTLPELTPKKIAKSDFAWVCQTADPANKLHVLRHVYYDARQSLAVATDGKACFRAKVDLGDDSGFFNSARVRLNVESDKGLPNWRLFVKKHTHKLSAGLEDFRYPGHGFCRLKAAGLWFNWKYLCKAFPMNSTDAIQIAYTPGHEIYPVEFRISKTRRATIMPCRNPEA